MSKQFGRLAFAGAVMSAAMVGAMGLGAGGAMAQQATVGLITKTDTNPFFVKMKEGAEAEAKKLGRQAQTFAGKYDGDNEAQVAAIESLIAAGAKGILITPSDTKAIVPTLEKARQAGILVIALDTPLNPIDAADATFATDNFKAGELIGQWATGDAGRQGGDRPRSRSSTSAPTRSRSTCCATRAS